MQIISINPNLREKIKDVIDEKYYESISKKSLNENRKLNPKQKKTKKASMKLKYVEKLIQKKNYGQFIRHFT